MVQVKNIIKYLIIGTIAVSLFVISIPNSKSNVIFNAELQDTIKTKEVDTLQNILNDYNKIAFQFDTINANGIKTEKLIDSLKKESTDIEQQCNQLKQELKCEEIDSCRKFLNRNLELLSKKQKAIKHYIDSLNGNIVSEKKITVDIQKKKEIQVNKIQNATSKISGSRKINYKGSWYYIFIVNTDSCRILMHHKDSLANKPYKTIDNVYRALVRKNLKPLMITNAGMYTTTNNPQGLFIENNKELYPIDITRPNDNNFYLKPNGVFFIDQEDKSYISTTEDFINKFKKNIKIKFATQSGPMLLINGNVHPAFTVNSGNKKIRSGVGIINNKKVVFAISLDEVNFYDFAKLFQDSYGCKDALFLDGAISRMYLFDKNSHEKGGNFGPIISVVKRTK